MEKLQSWCGSTDSILPLFTYRFTVSDKITEDLSHIHKVPRDLITPVPVME